MKKFITVTALAEGLTGIALIAIPNTVVLLLLGKPTPDPEGKLTAMLAGTAILTLAVICWVLRDTPDLHKLVKGMLFYNCGVIAIVLYGYFLYSLTNPGLWFVIFLHSILSVWGGIALRESRSLNV